MKTNTIKKVISIMLTVFMLMTMVPLTAFAVVGYPEIKLGDIYTVTEAGYVKFVPTESGIFIIRSVSDFDPMVTLYDSNMEELYQEDDSYYRNENDYDFYFEYEYTAGETYYFDFHDHNDVYNYTVFLVAPCTEHTGGTQTCMGYKCEVCGEWYGESGDHIDEDENCFCDVCDSIIVDEIKNEIKPGDTYTVTEKEYVKFVSTESCKFIIRSVSDSDPMVTLYDSDMESIHKEDDSNYRGENDLDFYLEYEYTAGETYYFEFYDHDGDYNYTVIFDAPCTEHTGGTQTCKGYQCEICGEWYGEAIEHDLNTEQTCKGYQCKFCEEWFGEADETKHIWYFGKCEFCDSDYPEDLECEHLYSHENDYRCITCGITCPHETVENGVCKDCSYCLPFLLTTGESVTYHNSFSDALYYAEDGSVIKLLRDYADYNNLEINKAITIDFNGKEWIQPSSGQFDINAHVIFTDSVGGGYLGYGLNLNSPVTFSGGSYRYILIVFDTEDTLGDYLADGYDYFDRYSNEIFDLSSEKYVNSVEIKVTPFTGIKDNHFYKYDVMQKAYQLVEFEGNYYFINDSHKLAKNKTLYLSERFVNGFTYEDGTPLAVGYYEFDENGKMIIKNGVVGDYFYKNNERLKAYQLVEFEGDFYFINDSHKLAKNKTLYLSERFVTGFTYEDGTPLQPGYYTFDENGKMVMLDGPVGDYFYKDNVRLKAYQLVEYEGDIYFVYNSHKLAKNTRLYLSERFVEGTDLKVGWYNFDADGKLIIE